jgi:lysophospholipid acyltransferase (LPLAT)-like uncharacterized protein
MWRRHILPFLAYWVYVFWSSTWRIKIVEAERLKDLKRNGDPLIFAHWHGDELAILHLVKTYKIATMTSTSADGSLINSLIHRFGGASSRGSSTRGGIAALKGLIRLMRAGYRASLALDGPKGPIHVVKPGVFELSRLASAYVVPMGVGASSTIVFKKSWNQAHLPKPFARVAVVFGEPWEPLTKQIDPREPELARQLAVELSDAHHQAAKLIADFSG